VVILAWIYAEPIVNRNAEFLHNGGTFLIPLPVAKTIDMHGAVALKNKVDAAAPASPAEPRIRQ
jgi:C-methyltransferase C-terminal domain